MSSHHKTGHAVQPAMIQPLKCSFEPDFAALQLDLVLANHLFMPASCAKTGMMIGCCEHSEQSELGSSHVAAYLLPLLLGKLKL